MASTVSFRPVSGTQGPAGPGDHALAVRDQAVVGDPGVGWAMRYRKVRLLGTGGQGVVYLSERQGTDGFALPVALKVFSPEPYRDAASYREDMGRIARTAARVALIQHDNLLDIHNFMEQDGIRVMEMEWLDGFDLRRVLTPRMMEETQRQIDPDGWEYLTSVVITEGPQQPRLKPGVAIQVLRECLAGLAALHREGIVHGDIKPSNVMLKRTGHAKVIDIGSAVDLNNPAARGMWSPAYAAPEVLEGGENTPQSDVASLGYVLVEMLAGRPPFADLTNYRQLVEAKKSLDDRLEELLPPEVSCNELLLDLCRRLVAPDPADRFADAQAADLDHRGAADFHRQLIKGDLASEYDNDLRVWLEQLG
ncbi:MAG TPA: serine/threonine-protein kinase [Gemmataceae bacterium]|nr:serine/threonine-protein kinase [Gemmataceae bacterium]